MTIPKEEAKKIIENMPEHVTWDDIMCQLYVKRKIANSLQAFEGENIVSHDYARKRLLGN